MGYRQNKPESGTSAVGREQHSPAYARRTPLLDLFPPITPYSSGFLEVGEPHNIYWEQSGNPEGVPILLLHGGPGAGATPTHRRFFDPDYYRIIIFDQRGAGRSHPLGSLENNTAIHLREDIEALRTHLRIERWHIFGGSWGSTLALFYASKHPQRCFSLILRGVFLCEQPEIEWFLYGMRTIFPEAWEQFINILKPEERENILDAYYARLTGDNPEVQLEAAIRWSLYEGACSSLLPNFETICMPEQKAHATALARIEAHYFKTQAFTPETSILNAMDILRKIPAAIIQGRYDMICPITTAHKIHLLWPEADYVVVPDAGHSALDPTVRSRLIEATENAKTIGR
jgi:proline iminopeptidase